jgi:hypothetical protein
MGSPPASTAEPGPERPDGPVDPGVAEVASGRYVVRGTSMRPALGEGDVITVVRPGDAGTIAAGEIVTFRGDDGQAVTHRLLGRDVSDGAPVMVTQGDGRTEPDPAWPEERLVGSVSAASGQPRRLRYRLLACERLAWWEAAERLATWARSWRPVRSLQRRLLGGSLSIREERRSSESGGWLAITCTAFDARGRAAGWQSVVRQGPDADTGRPLWLLFGLQVRLRYRGLGIGARLVAAGEAAVVREGGGLLYAFVRPGNRPSADLFRTAGWRIAAPPAGTARVPELASCLCLVKAV